MLPELTTSNLTAAFLAEFTGFFNRYYRSPTGKESQQWLLEYLKKVSPLPPVQSVAGRFRHLRRPATRTACADRTLTGYTQTAAKLNAKANITFTEFAHSWSQSSIIVKFEPAKAVKDAAPVVLSQSPYPSRP